MSRRRWAVAMILVAACGDGASAPPDASGPDAPVPDFAGVWSVVTTDTRSDCGTPVGAVRMDTWQIEQTGAQVVVRTEAGEEMPGVVQATVLHFGTARIDATPEGCRREIQFGGQGRMPAPGRVAGAVATSTRIAPQGACTTMSLCSISSDLEMTRR